MHWHEADIGKLLSALGVDPAQGLSSQEVFRRQSQYGPNALPEQKKKGMAVVYVRQFKSPLIYLLFVAAAVAAFLREYIDTGVILGIVVLNAAFGAFQERRAERSMEALRKLANIKALVLREGVEQWVEARQLVPGDVVVLSAGDAVGADARLIEVAGLEISEAALTGESAPICKETSAVPIKTTLADRLNMVYGGTHVTRGRGKAVVTATGLRAEVGKIAAITEAAQEPQTPLEQRLAHFGRQLAWAAGGIFILVVALGLLRGLSLSHILLVGITQTVSMVPEGLPVALTVALAVGMQRMAGRGALIRRLSAVETLGSTTVICSDKTGTLTRNEMTVTMLQLPEGGPVVLKGGESINPSDASLRLLIEAAVLCNDATCDKEGRPIGDPTETALLVLARDAGIDALALRANYPRRGEIPFDATTKMMATLHETPAGLRIYVKGAPEAVLALCSPTVPQEINSTVQSMAEQALRVLAFVQAEWSNDRPITWDALQGTASFLGLAGEMDPPRAEAALAVAECKRAGIRPMMITGDHKATGLAIARQIGIATASDQALDGDELDELNDAQLTQAVATTTVFARVRPEQKLRLVDALQAAGEVVAMTGDGVNDAPALAKADVGLAMGITGTEVAKGAAKVIILDDNFASIVKAVEEGRLVYKNLKKVILFLFTTSIDEVVVLVGALLLGFPLPLAAVQILWINIVTEGTLTLNLILDPPEGDEMSRPPTPLQEPLLTRSILRRATLMASASVAATLGYYAWRLSTGAPFALVQTETFTLLAICQWFNVLNCRSETLSVFSRRELSNKWLWIGLGASVALQLAVVYAPPLNRFFHTTPMSGLDFMIVGSVASLVLWVEELRKWGVRRRALPQIP